MVSAAGSLFFLLLLRDPHNILDVECDGGLMGRERPGIGMLSWFLGQKPGVKGDQVAGNRCWAATSDVDRVICGHHSLQALHKWISPPLFTFQLGYLDGSFDPFIILPFSPNLDPQTLNLN